jgi:trk system potassium uptake protein TrkA
MERNQAEVMEVQVDESSRWVGKQVRDLGLPTGAILGSIQRGSEIVIPKGDTRIESGDQIVVFALPRAVEETAEFFNR